MMKNTPHNNRDLILGFALGSAIFLLGAGLNNIWAEKEYQPHMIRLQRLDNQLATCEKYRLKQCKLIAVPK